MSTDLVWVVNVINLRTNVPDASARIYRNKEDAIKEVIKVANVFEIDMTEEEMREELEYAEGIDIPKSNIHILFTQNEIH